MESELRPCPACGHEAIDLVDDEDYAAVGCVTCSLRTDDYSRREDAREAWNTRPIEDALTARLAAAERERDEAVGLIRSFVECISRTGQYEKTDMIRRDMRMFIDRIDAPPRTEEES